MSKEERAKIFENMGYGDPFNIMNDIRYSIRGTQIGMTEDQIVERIMRTIETIRMRDKKEIRLSERKKTLEEVKVKLAKELSYESKYSEVVEIIDNLTTTK